MRRSQGSAKDSLIDSQRLDGAPRNSLILLESASPEAVLNDSPQ